jgi:drug/metabolite transporter (DMT)-like permease
VSVRAWTVFAALCVIWGIPYFFIKIALEEVSPFVVAWTRIAIAVLILLPIAWKRGVLRSVLAHKGPVIAFAFTELVGPFVLIAMGERWVTSSMAGILIATVPLAVILMSPLFGLRERVGTRRIIGLVLGFAGVVALVGLDSAGGPQAWLGVLCLFIATLGYAVGPLIIQRYLHDVDELGAVTISLGVAAIVLLPAAALTAPAVLPSAQTLTALVVLGAVCTAVGLYLFFYLIGQAGASRAAVITYVNPAVAALLGVLVLHEPFGVGFVAGFILILLGSWLATASGTTAAADVKSQVRSAG